MSGNNVPHQVLDNLRKFEASWLAKQNQLIAKHNELASQIVALEALTQQIAAFTASEVGKFQGTISSHVATLGRTTQGLDLNILALAEIAREVVGQLTQVDAIFRKIKASEIVPNLDLTDDDMIQVRKDAQVWFGELMANGFKTAREMIAKAEQDSIDKEAADKLAAQEAALAQESKSESDIIEKELKKASLSERSIVSTTSGGPGAEFPEGADIFGG